MEAAFVALGDTHGDLYCVERACKFAVRNGADMILQLGDWGFLWPGANCTVAVAEVVQDHGLKLAFIDGNHDWHEKLPFHYPQIVDGTDLARWDVSVVWIRRGDGVRWQGAFIVGMGGAPSIDRMQRKEGRSWWPEECITDADVERTLRHKGTPVDLLLTHDAGHLPAKIPALLDSDGRKRWFQPLADASLDRVRHVQQQLNPRLHLHGHYHVEYVDPEYTGYGGERHCPVIGLAHNYATAPGQCMKLVTVTDEKIVVDGVDVTTFQP